MIDWTFTLRFTQHDTPVVYAPKGWTLSVVYPITCFLTQLSFELALVCGYVYVIYVCVCVCVCVCLTADSEYGVWSRDVCVCVYVCVSRQ